MDWNVAPFKIFTISPESEFLINETLVLCPFKAFAIYTPVEVDRTTGEVTTELCEVVIISKSMECQALHDLCEVITAVRR